MSFGEKLKRFIADPDIALDLGTANTRLYAHGRGLVCEEPSVVVSRWQREAVRAGELVSGCAACVLPLRGGVVDRARPPARRHQRGRSDARGRG